MSRPTCSVTRSTSSRASTLGREVEPGGRRRGRARVARVDRLVALRVGQRLGDVRRERRLAVGLAVEPDEPASAAERLDELDRRRAACPRRNFADGRASASQTPSPAGSRSSTSAAPPPGRSQPQPRRDHARVVDDDELAAGQLVGQLAEAPMAHLAARALEHEQARRVARFGRLLRDQLGRKVVVERRRVHPTQEAIVAPVSEGSVRPIDEQIAAAVRDGVRSRGGSRRASPGRGARA